MNPVAFGLVLCVVFAGGIAVGLLCSILWLLRDVDKMLGKREDESCED